LHGSGKKLRSSKNRCNRNDQNWKAAKQILPLNSKNFEKGSK